MNEEGKEKKGWILKGWAGESGYEKGEAPKGTLCLGGDLLEVRLEVGDVEMATLGDLFCLVFIPST